MFDKLTVKTKNISLKILVCIVLLCLISMISYRLFSFKRAIILQDIYVKKSIEMKNEIAYFIKQKLGATAALTFVISQDKSITEALLANDPSMIDYRSIISGLTEASDYKNIWIQVIDKEGYNFYRSWMKKHGDYMARARKDIALMIKKPQPMSHLSTGKFDMSFKTMQPIYSHGEFIGMVEMITHFNSIAVKLKKRNIEPILLVEKKYTKQFIKPFTNLFVGENYVANSNASKVLMAKLAKEGVEKFLNIDGYRLFEDYLVISYDIPDIKGNPMGHGVLFYKRELLDMSELKTFELYFSIFLVALAISFVVLVSVFFLVKRSNDLKRFNKLLESEKKKAQQSERAKAEFLANMSHEIRTPLNAILGFIYLLKEDEVDSEKLRYIKTIEKSSQSLLNIINDILDFSKIESGKIEVDKTDFNGREEFQSIAQLFQAQCSEKILPLSFI